MAYADAAPVPFEIGRVMRRMTGSIGRRWKLLALVTMLFGILPGLVYQVGLQFGFDIGLRQAAATPLAMFANGGLASAWVLAMIVGIFAQAATILILATDQLGETPSLRTSLLAALAVLLPAIGLKIVVWLALGLAWLCFMVPALILFTRWFVALPALVVEQEGVLASLGRSRDLTDGARWPVFGLIAIIGVLYLMLLGVVMPLGLTTATNALGFAMVMGLLQQVVGSLGAIVWAAALVSTFLELREIKEGAPSSRLAEVFA